MDDMTLEERQKLDQDFERITKIGCERFPAEWLVCNEKAIHAAMQCRIEYYKQPYKVLLSLVVLRLLQTLKPDAPQPQASAQSETYERL